VDKRRVVEILLETGKLLEIQGANPFRVRAYENAARALRGLTDDLGERVAAGDLAEIPGIGKGLAETIAELWAAGQLELHRELREAFPPGVLELARLEGIGAKKLRVLVEQEGITTPEGLEAACREGRIARLPGFGEKTQARVLRSLAELARYRDRFLLSEALRLADELSGAIRAAGWQEAGVAGSARRGLETVGDLDLVVGAPVGTREELVRTLEAHPGVERIVAAGDTKVTLRAAGGWQVDVRMVGLEEVPSALHHFTGSKEHNVRMRGRAKERGLTLNEYGLFRGDERLPVGSEEDLFSALDLQPIPPELREGEGEIEAAQAGTLPELVTLDDLQGTFHVHTDWSDGTASLEVMARVACERGWQYLGIADHSQAAAYAGGLTPDRVREQGRAIAALNARAKAFRLFHGIECDILADGSLDLPDDVLAELDFVVASVHSRLDMPSPEMTRRLLRALDHRHVTMLGHLTGRLLLRREGAIFDLEAVLEKAAKRDVIVELNCAPRRLDLDWRHLRGWLAAGNLTSINPDAHDPAALDHVDYGVRIARKAWATPESVLNTRPVGEVEEWLRGRR
jgi:DNA polymerase (family 10)